MNAKSTTNTLSHQFLLCLPHKSNTCCHGNRHTQTQLLHELNKNDTTTDHSVTNTDQRSRGEVSSVATDQSDTPHGTETDKPTSGRERVKVMAM